MRELERCDDALERHAALFDRLRFDAPPSRARDALDRYDRCPIDDRDAPLDALIEYTTALDARAHSEHHERNTRSLEALSPPVFDRIVSAIFQHDSRSIDRWMGVVLGLDAPAAVRTEDAYARGGLHRYSLANGALEARWRRGVERDEGREHRVVRGARLYFDAIFLHPFDDGNARLARALLVGALDEGPAIEVAPAVWIAKRPGDDGDFWRFVTVCASGAEARARRRYHRALR